MSPRIIEARSGEAVEIWHGVWFTPEWETHPTAEQPFYLGDAALPSVIVRPPVDRRPRVEWGDLVRLGAHLLQFRPSFARRAKEI